jgi:hypothetical protein
MTRENRRRFLVLLLLPMFLLFWYAIFRNLRAPAESPTTVSDGQRRLRSERRIVYPAQSVEPGYVPFSQMETGVPDLGSEYVLAGKITTAEGTQLPSDGNGLRSNGSTETDPDGRFSLALSFPLPTSITASKDGYTQERVDLSGNSSSYIEIRLARADTGIFGTVVDENGRPARRFMITAHAVRATLNVT